jgi:N-acetylglucosamine kinase-like BadF-type ATPase/phosphoheptose isomerase
VRLVERHWPQAQVAVGSDRASGFATALAGRDGITVIAGTGSAVTGRRGDRIEKAGGWGQLLGDKGGGYNLAVQALRRVLSDYDIDQRVGILSQSILRRLSLNRLDDLVAWASTADKMSVAMLAPVVFEAAARGHKEMLSAMQGGAQILAAFTGSVAKRLELDAPEVKLTGGLFVHHPAYVELYREYLSNILPSADVSVCSLSGGLGAAWLASQGSMATPEAVSTDREVVDLATAATEQRNPRSTQLDKLTSAQLVDLFVTEEDFVTQALGAVREELVAAIDLVAVALANGGRLFYAGAGTSGRLGVLDASEIPPTFGTPAYMVQGIMAGGATALHSAVEGAEDQAEAGAMAITERGANPGDVVCGITASGRTPFVHGVLQRAAELRRENDSADVQSATGADGRRSLQCDDRSADRTRDRDRLNAVESRNRDEGGAEHHLHMRHDSARQSARQPDDRRERLEREAARSGRAAGERASRLFV